MWETIKSFFFKVKPDLIRFLKAAAKLAIDTLLPVALDAVMKAEANGGSGKDKYNFAVNYVKIQAPKATAGAVMTAVQAAWATKEAEGWQ